MLIRKEETESKTKLCSDSEYRQRSSAVNPEEAEEVYDKPSLETAKWSVYWDPDQADWYFYNKISGKSYKVGESVYYIILFSYQNTPLGSSQQS